MENLGPSFQVKVHRGFISLTVFIDFQLTIIHLNIYLHFLFWYKLACSETFKMNYFMSTCLREKVLLWNYPLIYNVFFYLKILYQHKYLLNWTVQIFVSAQIFVIQRKKLNEFTKFCVGTKIVNTKIVTIFKGVLSFLS